MGCVPQGTRTGLPSPPTTQPKHWRPPPSLSFTRLLEHPPQTLLDPLEGSRSPLQPKHTLQPKYNKGTPREINLKPEKKDEPKV